MEQMAEVMSVENIQNKVYVIRGQQVMLDYDLAEIYGYEVKRLNEQVKRNIARFPEDFMFQLTTEEDGFLKSQIATSSWGGKRKLPYAFTEQGIYMLATVLRGELAEQQSIFIMRAFREMRHYIKQNQQFVTQSEMHLVSVRVSEISVQMANMADRQKKTEQDVQKIQKSIDTLNENFISGKDFKNYVIYKGQKFEADAAYIDIYQQAKKSIYVVDDYVNTKTLQLLSQKQSGVEVVLFTENGHGKRGFLTTAVVNDFIQQYPPLRMKPNADCHDRLIVLDYGLPREQAYHCGASSKDAGKKLCAINVIGRILYIRKSMNCELVTGTVVNTRDQVRYTGRNRSYTYTVWVEYQPPGYPLVNVISEENPKFNLSKGDKVLVLYQKDKIYNAYVAKKDWLTGYYLPENKSFTLPLVIAVVLICVGYICYTNSPILDWYTNGFRLEDKKK